MGHFSMEKSLNPGSALSGNQHGDAVDQLEAAMSRRLDKLGRQIDTLDLDLAVLGETVAQFIHYWMTITPPLPDAARQSARAKAAERFEGFMQNLGRRLATGDRFLKELSRDVSGDEAFGLAAEPQTIERGV